MSIVSTSANYGGKVDTQQGNIKQFVVSSTLANWIYKKLKNGLLVQTPANQKIPVLITSDLIVTGSLYNTSDERLKNNISEIKDESVDKLFTLNPIIFSYKNDLKHKRHYGVIAQDVEKLFPELVENNNISGYKTVNYQELMPIMLAKMKKMQNELDELKEHVNIQLTK
jgi:hypothetical protein